MNKTMLDKIGIIGDAKTAFNRLGIVGDCDYDVKKVSYSAVALTGL